jgi:hypothetical protein
VNIWAWKFTLTEDATVTKLYTYIAGAGVNLKLGIYNDNSGTLDTFQGGTGVIVGGSAGWVNGTCNIALTAGDYWLAVLSSEYLDVYYDSGALTQGCYEYSSVFYPNFPSTYTADYYYSRIGSIWADYTVPDAEIPDITRTETPPPPTRSRVTSVAKPFFLAVNQQGEVQFLFSIGLTKQENKNT